MKFFNSHQQHVPSVKHDFGTPESITDLQVEQGNHYYFSCAIESRVRQYIMS